MPLRVLSAILFSPRGGSASAARALVRGLRAQGCEVTLVAGSRSDLGAHGNAASFYGDVRAVSFDRALASGSPMADDGAPGSAPLHPSYEDRPGAADVVFATLDDLDYECQVRAWSRELTLAGAGQADVLHLHHLTPINEAARRAAPEVPIVGQIHGTELLMLERIDAGAPAHWHHAERWAARMRRWARECARLVVTPSAVNRHGRGSSAYPEIASSRSKTASTSICSRPSRSTERRSGGACSSISRRDGCPNSVPAAPVTRRPTSGDWSTAWRSSTWADSPRSNALIA